MIIKIVVKYKLFVILYIMFFLKDDKNKVVFGWSAKCGCSHIKMIYKYLSKNNINFHTRHRRTMFRLGFIDDNYTIILFIRNPFIRLVSAYLEKYRINGQLRHLWKTKVLNFKLIFYFPSLQFSRI